MRLGFVISRSDEQLTGGLVYNDRLIRHLRAAGDDVEIIAVPPKGSFSALARNRFGATPERIRGGSFDALLQDEFCFASLFDLNQRLDVPTVAIVHHLTRFEPAPMPRRLAISWLERRYLRVVDGFVCASKATLDAIHLVVPDETPAIVARPGNDVVSGVSVEDIGRRANELGPLRLLYVGGVVPRKRLDVLLAALHQAPGVELDVVGSLMDVPSFAERVRELAAAPDLHSRVRIHGRLDDAHVATLYRQAHALVLPSTYEGFGMVHLEAMAYGVVPIGGERGGTRELIRHGENGLLVAPRDVQGLARLILLLEDDRMELTRLGRSALGTAQAWPSWDETFAPVRDFIAKMAARRA